MGKPIDALDYLARPERHSPSGVCVLFGDEPFLKRLVLAELKGQVLAGDDAEFSTSVFAGGEATLGDVNDALASRALFGGGRHLVIVEDADEFVSQNRAALEDYVARPRGGSVLVLDAKAWASTTRLYKALTASGLQIECKFPAPARLLKWLADWSATRHQAKLEAAAAEMLVEIVEPELGLIDQELAKLAALAGPGATITAPMVRTAVGGWRAQTAWDMLDAALAGDTATALVQLDRLLASGEVPIALMGQLGATLRRFAAATQLIEQAAESRRTLTLRHALEEAGVKSFFSAKAETQLRRLGRARGSQLYRWLLETDLALKGSSSAPARARLALETLIVKLSLPPAPPASRAGRLAALR